MKVTETILEAGVLRDLRLKHIVNRGLLKAVSGLHVQCRDHGTIVSASPRECWRRRFPLQACIRIGLTESLALLAATVSLTYSLTTCRKDTRLGFAVFRGALL